jgi:hypothetical protein
MVDKKEGEEGVLDPDFLERVQQAEEYLVSLIFRAGEFLLLLPFSSSCDPTGGGELSMSGPSLKKRERMWNDGTERNRRIQATT